MQSRIRSLIHSAVLLLLPVSSLLAGSATWNENPISNDWDDPANWTPQTVPQEQTDVATFGVSSITNPVFSNWTEVYLGELVFNPGASNYTIGGSRLALFGPGLVNNSGIAQTVATDFGFEFLGASRAGDNVTYTVHPDLYYSSYFFDESSAGTATFLVDGLIGSGYEPGVISFGGSSSAADSTIVLATGDVYGGEVSFDGFSNAGASNITAAAKAFVGFGDYASAATATITTDGARVYFGENSIGGAATLNLTNGSTLDLSNHDTSAIMTVGPLTTDATSTINLGGTTLSIFGPSFGTYSSNVAGVISGTGGIVLGEGTEVTFSAANTYAGGTIINGGGKLILVPSKGGSATGTGPVTVINGSLGGYGLITGAVSLGGVRPVQQANLDPKIAKPVSLKIKGSLSFGSFCAFKWRLNTSKASAVEVTAKGVTIIGNATFDVIAGGADLPIGTVFTVISNTGKTPITGRFSNLPDGGTISAGGNSMQINYEGGDGNDLTLTVIGNSHPIRLEPRH